MQKLLKNPRTRTLHTVNNTQSILSYIGNIGNEKVEK